MNKFIGKLDEIDQKVFLLQLYFGNTIDHTKIEGAKIIK